MNKWALFFFLIYPLWLSANSNPLPPVIDNSSYPAGKSGHAKGLPSNNSLYEILARMEQMQAELQLLRGQVEEQSQTIFNLQTRQSNIYKDLDQRVQQLAEATQPVIEAVAALPNTVAQPVAVAAVNANSTTANSVEQQKKEPARSQKELYQEAYETLRNGHNSRAITAFKSLLKLFPEGEYADNSQYWLGEAYKVNKDYSAAKKAFKTVLSRYKTSPKVPDALLKLAYIEVDQKNMAKAKDYLTQITLDYPGTTAEHLARKKLVQLGMAQP